MVGILFLWEGLFGRHLFLLVELLLILLLPLAISSLHVNSHALTAEQIDEDDTVCKTGSGWAKP